MSEPTLKGYVVHDGEPEEFAILVFARSEDEAVALGRPVIEGIVGGPYSGLEVFADGETVATPEAWGVTEPCVLEPEVCWGCERWRCDKPIGEDGRCDACREEDDHG